MRCEKAILITTLMRGRCFRKALRHYVLHAPIRHLLTIKRTKMNTTSLNHQFLVLKLPAVLAKEVGFHIQAITGVHMAHLLLICGLPMKKFSRKEATDGTGTLVQKRK